MKKIVKNTVFVLLVVVFILWFILPYIWQFITALTPTSEISQVPPVLPSHIDWSHYKAVLFETDFYRFILNSFIVAGLTSILAAAFGTFAAFATSRYIFRWKALTMSIILGVSMFPPIAIVSPLYLIIRSVDIRDTYLALILPYASFGLPFMIWTLHNFFRELPEEIIDAARIDGCSPWQIYSRIVLPLTRPAVFTTAILVFIFAWNEFIFALTFTSTSDAQTIPVGIALFPGIYEIPWGDIAAATIIVTLPLVILVILLQRQIISGLLSGSVKG